MESWRHWDDFLKIMSRDNQLTDAETESFLLQFDRQNIGKSLPEIAAQLPLMEDALANHKKRMSEVYGKFSQHNGIELKPKNNKSKPLQKWLEAQYSQWLPVQDSESALSSATTAILMNWQEICRDRLEKQKQLTTNRLMLAKAMVFNLDDIDVDLALVERKKPDKRSGDDRPEKSRLYQPDYEESEKLEYQEFLGKVLKPNQNNKIAVIGEAGAGKTTLLQRIAFWILENTDYLPIWVPLGNLPTPAPPLKEYLLNRWLEDTLVSITPEIKANFEKQLTDGKVWLLLDGVDEMAASGNPLTFIDQWIPAWSHNLPVMLTCRLNVWEANPYALNGFQTYRTLWFSEKKVKKFIHDGFQKSDPALGVQLQEALNQPGKERIKDLVRNPLRLMLLCSIWHLLDGKLPDTKAELYQQYVEEVYRWKQDEFPTTPEERQQLNAKLGELAKESIDKQENRFFWRMEFVKGVLGEGSLFQLALKVGWLNQVGVDARNPLKAVYAFYHPTFQEYFAATAIDDRDFFLPRQHQDKPVADKYRIFESQWKEVILLWLGRPEEWLRKQKEEFIKALVEFEDGCNDFYWYQAYFLAATGIAEFWDCCKADKILEQIVKWSYGYPHPEQQGWVKYRTFIQEGAMVTLQHTNRQMLIKALIRLLHNNQYKGKAKHEIMNLLGKIGTNNEQAVQALEDILKNSKNENKCCVIIAACSLGKIAKGELKITAIKKLIDLVPEWDAVIGLGEINFRDLDGDILNITITELTKHLKYTSRFDMAFEPPFNALFIAQTLTKIAPRSHPSYSQAIEVLKEINAVIKEMQDAFSNDLNSRLTDLGLYQDSEVINTVNDLINLMCSDRERRTREKAAWCLEVILFNKQFAPKNDLFPSVVNSLRAGFEKLSHINYRTYALSFGVEDPLNSCYNLLWHYAQELPYTVFYQAYQFKL